MTRGGPGLAAPDHWAAEIAVWAGWLRAAGQTPGTIGQRTYHLRRLAVDHAAASPWDLTLDDLTTWLGAHDWSVATRRMYRASLRAFYRWAQMTQRVGDDPALLLPPVRVPEGQPRPAPETVIVNALERADDRTNLMIRLAATVGLRRSELAIVHTDDVQRYGDGWQLRVLGKGGKTRVLPLPDALGEALSKLPPGYAFPGWDQEPMTPAHIGKIVSRVLGAGWTTHTLRHRFASKAYLADRDIMAVRDLLGHANVRTTQIYTAVPVGARRSAVNAAAEIG